MKKSATVTPRVTLRRSLLSMAVAAATFGMAPAHAVQFELMDGEVTGAFDTTVSYGALWRVTGQDSRLLSISKGGTRNSANYDNGNANYDRGDLVSSIFRVSNDLDINYKNFGAFFRVSSFYDHAIQNKDFDPNRADQRTIRNRLGHDYEIYDAFVRGKFTVLDRNLGIRIGKQVISLGESTFIPNGLNALNPVDVSKLRSPGAEIKEALLPTQMLQLTYDLTDNLSVELINKFQFRPSRPEPNGSYFSSNDFLSPGGSQVLIGQGNDTEANPVFIGRAQDKKAKHTGQYALVTRLLIPELNNTEFGLYFANYHQSAPLIAGQSTSLNQNDLGGGFSSEAFAIAQLGALANGLNLTPAQLAGIASVIQSDFDASGNFIYQNNTASNTGLSGADLRRAQLGARAATSNYRAEYAENIRIFGLSFNTLGPLGIALQGEYSYRPNQPLNLVANNTLNTLLLRNGSFFNTGLGAIDPDQDLVGYKRVKMHQIQMTATQTLGRYLGAAQIVALGEVGYTYLDLPKGIDFNGPGVDFSTPIGTNGPLRPNSDSGIYTSNSYGYRAAIRASYPNAIGAVNLTPRVAFQHDLRGTSPTFTQNTQSATIGLTADYQNRISADISYTNFFGGESIGVTNTGIRSTNQQLADRDFIAATISYAF